MSDDLCVIVVFYNNGSNILIHVRSINILNDNYVCSVNNLFYDSQVVNISVAVEVEVADLP